MAMATATSTGQTDEQPWHAAFPAPKTTAKSLPRAELLKWMMAGSGKQPGRDFVVVDLRRNDHEGGTIRRSINLPAQSLYPSIPTLYNLFSASGVKYVIWFCGSSRGRGTRAAGWFADYIQAQDDSNLQSLVLEGGIKGWVAEGKEYRELMDGFEEAAWEKMGVQLAGA